MKWGNEIKRLRDIFGRQWKKALARATQADVTSDQLAKLGEVFGDNWQEILEKIETNTLAMKAQGLKTFGGETMTGYKTGEFDLAEALSRAIARLEEVGVSVPDELTAALEALVEKDEDPTPTPASTMDKKTRREHPLEALAEGTPLGPRKPVQPVGRKYVVDINTGRGHLVSVEEVGVKAGESVQHPLLERLGAGTGRLGITTDELYDRQEAIKRGGKVVTGSSPLLRRDTVLHKTTEELEAARKRKAEELEAVKAIEDAAQPAVRYRAVTCPVCGYSHRIGKGGLVKTSQYCPRGHGDIMQPTFTAGDVAQARQSAPRQLPGGGGLKRSGGQ